MAGFCFYSCALLRVGFFEICPRLALPKCATAARLRPDVFMLRLRALHGVTAETLAEVSTRVATPGFSAKTLKLEPVGIVLIRPLDRLAFQHRIPLGDQLAHAFVAKARRRRVGIG